MRFGLTQGIVAALAVVGVAVQAAVAWHWVGSSELANRAIVLVVAFVLIVRVRPKLLTAERATPPGVFGAFLLIAALVVLPSGWYLLAQVGPRPVLLWWLYLGWLLMVCGTLLSWRGVESLRALAFPCFFLAFTLPAPQRFEDPLQLVLQQATTTFSSLLLRAIGFEVGREGFVLHMASGDLGVLEACSGIRSVLALSAVAALLAYLRGYGPFRGSLLLGAALPVVVLSNVFRVTASGILQEGIGPFAIRGTPHELLGFLAFLLGLASLMAIAHALRPQETAKLFLAENQEEIANPLQFTSRFGNRRRMAVLLTMVTTTSCAAAIIGWNSVRRAERIVPLEQLADRHGVWQGEEAPIPDGVRDILTYDRASHRVFRNGIGQEVHVWVMFWSGSGSVRGYHHPEVCWPNRGFKMSGKRTERIQVANDCGLPVEVREFRSESRRQLVCYWTQEGDRVWTDDDESTARREGTPRHRWVRERLIGASTERTGRLAVVIGTELWGSGSYADRAVLALVREVARDIYELMPWAKPALP